MGLLLYILTIYKTVFWQFDFVNIEHLFTTYLYLIIIIIIRFWKLNTSAHANAYFERQTIEKSESGAMQDRIQIIWIPSKNKSVITE